jgi:sec-independent protein translocase protein TatB
MFDIGWSELLVIAVVAIVVVGPQDLPKLMRSVGHYAGKLRRAASDFQRQFEDAMRESEIEEMRKSLENVRAETTSLDLKARIDKPVMLPKPARGEAESSAAKRPPQAPAPKRAPAKPKRAGTKAAKRRAERAP